MSDLKKTRDSLVGAVLKQVKEWGDPLPSSRAAEDFVDPIIRKVDVDLESQPSTTSKESQRTGTKKLDKDGWVGEPQHSPRMPEGTKISYENLGEFEWNLRTNEVAPKSGAKTPWARPKENLRTASARECFRLMRLMPEWRELVEKAAFSALKAEQKEAVYRRLLVTWRKFFGDPRKPLGPRIQVG